jgi:hypothetical protein
MPTKRQATLIIHKLDLSRLTLEADFDQLTLARTLVGGRQREMNGTKPISPASAESFWTKLEQLAAKGFQDSGAAPIQGELWRFSACHGQKSYEASGVMLTDMTMGDLEPDSGADLCALFDLLKS